MGLQINQYPNTATALDPLAVFDADNWTGSAFQSEQVPMPVMEAAFTKNIINSNLTQTANRVQDFAGFTQYWKNNNQLTIDSSSTPLSGANMEFQGFGTTASDEIINVKNNLGATNTKFYGDGLLKNFNRMSVGAASGGFTTVSMHVKDSKANGVYVEAQTNNFNAHTAVLTGYTGSIGYTSKNIYANSVGFYAQQGFTSNGLCVGAHLEMDSVNTGTNNSLLLDARNGGTNLAIDILRGDIQFSGAGAGTKIGLTSSDAFAFWGASPVAQQVLATGAGNTVDDVITALQTIGLFKQS